jgi:hypothetical protein
MSSLRDVGLMLCICCALPSDGSCAPGDIATHGSRDGLHLEAQSFCQVTGARVRETRRHGVYLTSMDLGASIDFIQESETLITILRCGVGWFYQPPIYKEKSLILQEPDAFNSIYVFPRQVKLPRHPL